MRNLFGEEIGRCNRIVFNRPMGVFKRSPFRMEMTMVAELMAEAMDWGATTIMGET